MILHQLIADIPGGRLPEAFAGYMANRSSKELGYSLQELVNGYVYGRRWRHNLYNEFRNRFGGRLRCRQAYRSSSGK